MTTTANGREVTYELPHFLHEMEWWRDEDPVTGRRVVELVELAIASPKAGRGRPKRIGGLPGVWSRRITKHHRLFYLVTDDELHFISCRGHDMPQHIYEAIREGKL